MIILIKLILAHLLGDFLFQPDSWVKAKEKNRLESWELYIHALIHFVLIMILVSDLNFWAWALLLAVLHLITDIIKLFLQTKKTRGAYFFADQVVHLMFICLVWIFYRNRSFAIPFHQKEYYIALITFVYALTQPASLFIRWFISRWSPEGAEEGSGSLARAGNWIGIFERLFVFAFVIMGQWEGIGFLLAAKSVFRFGDLKESKDRKLTEYVLIGTLLSFGFAVFLGILFLKVELLL